MPPPARARDWAAGLPAEILADILHLLPSFADHLHFAAVCSSWRSVAKHSRRRHRSPIPSPWVLLKPRKSPTDARGPLHFLRPSDGRLLPIPLPYPGHPECVGISPDGWLILDDGGPRRLHAINPLTGRTLLLPSPAAVRMRTVAHKVTMSTCPYAEDASLDVVDAGWPRSAVFAAVLTCDYDVPLKKSVALARPGDRRWEALRMGHLKEVFDVTYHQGKFYILGNMRVVDGNRLLACVGVVDFSANDPLSTAKVTVLPLDYRSPLLHPCCCLIGSPSGDLLLAETLYGISRIGVFLVDLHATGNLGGSQGQKVVKLTDLGDRALLLGDPCCMAVSTRWAPQLRGNCSHWIRNVGSRSSVKVFSFDTERVETRRLPRPSMAAWFAPGSFTSLLLALALICFGCPLKLLLWHGDVLLVLH